MTLSAFTDLFKFDTDRAYQVGIERECFVTDHTGKIVPRAFDVLKEARHPDGSPRADIGYELSACQLEMRAGPCSTEDMPMALRSVRETLEKYLTQRGLCASFAEVAPASMPLDVYPDPTGRYQRITRTMPVHILQAACRIIGTHVHVGMPDHGTALRAYNRVIKHADRLRSIGDRSRGERMRLYRIVSPYATPVQLPTWEEFYAHAVTNGYVLDPRKNWSEIRISAHGTIEFRLFGASASDDENMQWIRECHALCID